MTNVKITSPLNRTEVYHTCNCKNVEQIRRHDYGKALRTDLTIEQVEQWGKRECARCRFEQEKESHWQANDD